MLLGDVLSWRCVFNLGDAFDPGFYGLRYASEHPADGSPLGPANPSRNFVFRLKYFFFGRCLWPGLLRARFARFLLRK